MIKIKEEYIKTIDNIELFVKKNTINNPIASILIIHGFAEHLGRYDYIANALSNLGFNIYRFDNRGHGKSKGERGDLEDFNLLVEDTDKIIDLIKRENKELPIYILGHSMGGFIAAAYGIKYGNKINGEILSGGATLVPDSAKGLNYILIKTLNKILPKIKIKNNLSNYICSDRNIVKDYKNDILNLKKASVRFHYQFVVEGINWLNYNLNNYKCQCLVLHGKEDKIISYNASENFYKKISSKDKDIILYEELFHEILNENKRDEIVLTIANWIKRQTN